MEVKYTLYVDEPHTHMLKVLVKSSCPRKIDKLRFFLPSWSPGSYLMREYSRNIRHVMVNSPNGSSLYFEQVSKGTWEIDFSETLEKEFEIFYEIYCHELTVRTSFIDESHAFLHGPSIFIGFENQLMPNPKVEVNFPPLWSKVTTGLKDISTKREIFLYEAVDYDDLLDCPIEIGCHDTDGFSVGGKDHELAFYGVQFPHDENLKKDIKIIVKEISKTMGEIPYDRYLFITHFVPDIYGGLEHRNSSVLAFDGTKLNNRKSYLNWLSLVAHEYFHTWNVKRIRPKELGPFNYTEENYTRMLWLAEGLTSFMDDLFVLRAGLCSLEEYLETIKRNLHIYFITQGKKFHSLEESSFNAWIKLYRPDENIRNTSISYYLKGGIVFYILNVMLHQSGSNINELLKLLWSAYKRRPDEGLTKLEVYEMIESLAGVQVRGYFESFVETRADIDLVKYFKKMGLKLEFEVPVKPCLGCDVEFKHDRVYIKSVTLDSPAYKCGLNAGDEIIAINGVRVMKENFVDHIDCLKENENYLFAIARQKILKQVTIQLEKEKPTLKEIKILDRAKVLQVLGVQ